MGQISPELTFPQLQVGLDQAQAFVVNECVPVVRTIHEAFVKVGFTDAQAFELVRLYWSQKCKPRSGKVEE